MRAREYHTTVLTGIVFRAAALAASALLHVLVYGALSLAPAWTPPTRTGLIVTDLIVNEPAAPAIATPRLVTPPRPLAKPQPSTSRAERPRPDSAAKIEPSIEREASEPPAQAEPTIVVADETPPARSQRHLRRRHRCQTKRSSAGTRR